MMKRGIRLFTIPVLFLGIIWIFATQTSHAAPNLVNYQGSLTDSGGTPVPDGDYPMTFRVFIVDIGGTPLWEETQSVTVTSGIYNVLLGSGTTNLSYGAFDPMLFSGDARWLEVMVDTEVLTPRQQVTSVAYALQAQEAAHAVSADNATTVGDADTVDGVHAADLEESAEIDSDVAAHESNTSAHHTKTSKFAELSGQASDAQVPASIARDLELTWGNLLGIPADFADNVDNEGITSESDPQVGSISLNYVPKWDGTSLVTGSIYDNGNVGIGRSNPTYTLDIGEPGGDVTVRLAPTYAPLDGTASSTLSLFTVTDTDFGDLYTENVKLGSATSFLLGNVGIGTAAPGDDLHVADHIRVGEDASYPTVYGELIHDGGGTGFKINANAGGGSWADMLFQTNGTTRMFLESSGKFGIGTTAPSTKLHVQGGTDANFSNGSGYLVMGPESGVNMVIDNNEIIARNNGNPSKLYLNNGGDNVVVPAIEITGGADIAEPFTFSESDSIKPGMVVAIDPEHPGQLRIADKAYDPTVAGIISGANGIHPGMTLSQKGTIADGSMPVALAGRVYALADATYSAIQPGDLLTSSDNPGYVMKVTDHTRAQGTILGKAMTSLDKGRGLVLILVTLQ